MLQRWCIGLAAVLSLSACDPSPANQIDQTIQRVQQSERVPGIAVGIWKEGIPLLVKGYGINDLADPAPVTENTLFKLGSVSKAFTAAALALLVDQGQIRWDSRVREFLPQFALQDPWISAEFRVEDLLTHRSGLSVGAGDLMLWPQPNAFSRADVLQGLSYLPLKNRFRAQYAYDNLLYIVAGELIQAVSGASYEQFVQQQLLQPLGMQHCFSGPVPVLRGAHLAAPHLLEGGALQVDDINRASAVPLISGAAGGLHCSVADMGLWLNMLLADGVGAEGQRVLSQTQIDRLWQPITPMPQSEKNSSRYRSHFYSYALGWRVQDMNGYRVLHHTGSLSGMYAWNLLVPELKISAVVLMNRSSEKARQAIADTIIGQFLGLDMPANVSVANNFLPDTSTVRPLPENSNPVSEQDLIGDYHDPWFGAMSIRQVDKNLRFQALKSPRLSGQLQPKAQGVWLLVWDDRSLQADAYLSAENSTGKTRITLEPQNTDIDFSYDFQDLHFSPLNSPEESSP